MSATALADFKASPLLFLAHRVYAWTQPSVPVPPTEPSPTDIRVVCISDTHNTHGTQPPLPAGDILLHAGDLTQSGTLSELCDALAWLSVQPHPVKVFIAGNHDAALAEPETRAYVRQAYPALTYLENEVVQVTVQRHTLRIYGSPYTPQYGSWPFQYPRFRPTHPRLSGALSPVGDVHYPSAALWSGVPPRIDVLLTHGPPLGHLDHGAGCAVLLSTLWRVRPRLHVFGHIHTARGVERVRWDDVQPAFEAVCLRGRQRRGGYEVGPVCPVGVASCECKVVCVVVGTTYETDVGTGNNACECGECARRARCAGGRQRAERCDRGGCGFRVLIQSACMHSCGDYREGHRRGATCVAEWDRVHESRGHPSPKSRPKLLIQIPIDDASKNR